MICFRIIIHTIHTDYNPYNVSMCVCAREHARVRVGTFTSVNRTCTCGVYMEVRGQPQVSHLTFCSRWASHEVQGFCLCLHLPMAGLLGCSHYLAFTWVPRIQSQALTTEKHVLSAHLAISSAPRCSHWEGQVDIIILQWVNKITHSKLNYYNKAKSLINRRNRNMKTEMISAQPC